MKKLDIATLNAVKAQAAQQISKPEKKSSLGAGRKPKPQTQKATQRFAIMLTKEEGEKLSQAAREASLPVASYIKNILKKEGAI